jgi:glycosyltransferase involved in cell wall biosynthesis
MKVLMVCNKAPYPPNDGSSIAIYNMARGLLLNNAEVHLLTINTKKHFKGDEEVPKEFRDAVHYKSVYRDTDVTLFGALGNLFSSASYFVSRFYFEQFKQELIATLSKNKFDLIQLEGLFMGVYLDVIKHYSNAKIVLRAHNVEYLIWERHLANEKPGPKKTYLSLQAKRLKTFEEKVVKEVDAIVSITDVDGKMLQQLSPGKKGTTCITGVDPLEYANTSGIKQKEKSVFIFSSMDWLPNIEAVNWFVSNCWNKIHKAVPECKLVIAGRNMPEQIRKMTLPNVLIVENVKSSKEFYLSHSIMLVPLLSGSGLRIKLVEGMAYGKAIVSTTVGAEGIKGLDKEKITLADGADDFANAVIGLLQDDVKRKKMEEAALKHAETHFSNEIVVKELVKFYTQLIV